MIAAVHGRRLGQRQRSPPQASRSCEAGCPVAGSPVAGSPVGPQGKEAEEKRALRDMMTAFQELEALSALPTKDIWRVSLLLHAAASTERVIVMALMALCLTRC